MRTVPKRSTAWKAFWEIVTRAPATDINDSEVDGAVALIDAGYPSIMPSSVSGLHTAQAST